MAETQKLCPLVTAGVWANSNTELVTFECEGERCAWWCAEYDCCTVLDIAGSLASFFEDRD